MERCSYKKLNEIAIEFITRFHDRVTVRVSDWALGGTQRSTFVTVDGIEHEFKTNIAAYHFMDDMIFADEREFLKLNGYL